MIDPTIIANYGESNVGKTTSIKSAYQRLRQLIPDEDCQIIHSPEQNNGDICAILTINNVKVGISSLGDNCPEHLEWLNALVKDKCKVILAACQWGGDTVKNIKSFQSSYHIIWAENARLYQEVEDSHVGPRGIQHHFNEQWAEEIANLIESWCYA